MRKQGSRQFRKVRLISTVGSIALLASLFLFSNSFSNLVAATAIAGIPVNLSHACPSGYSEDNRTVVVQLLASGRTLINSDDFPESQIPSLITEIMKTRAEPVLYVTAENDVPYGRVVRVIDRVRSATPYLPTVLLPRHNPASYVVDWCISSHDIWPSDRKPM